MNLEAMQGVMLAIAGAQDTHPVLDQIVEGIAACQNVALVRIWLVQPTETGERVLQLAASAGNLGQPDADPKRLDGRFSRFAMGVCKIGKVGAESRGILIPDIERDSEWIADPAWAISEGIRSFAAQPLIARDETLGVIGLFDRSELGEADFAWLRTFADHAAVAISNARAFGEVRELKERLELDNAYLREEVKESSGAILGRSLAIGKLRAQIEMVAPTEAGVLILGESGAGKELVARAIHEHSRRASRPLVRVNCGAIPGELFESEFFGHVQGAFTGALRDRIGRFELADGGTLFLDEVGEIPLQHQAKLLRVLQEKSFERVGDEQTRKADVRIIAATNRDLATEAREGRFRTDLYYRLGVFPITVPPLRERREDLTLLAETFAAQAARRLGTRPPAIPPRELARLQAYDWPGNVRELQHVVERAVILARGSSLRFGDLIEIDVDRDRDDAPAPTSVASEKPTSLADLKILERRIIEQAYIQAGRKVSGPKGAAAILGIPASTLESKLRAHGLK
ncbi:MAG: sigma 54-interacting transcriptional regulator [Planctomycetes bacterium]|nr:sigma 54-interacting transcriptional regulator [Planctomycetota bacterium]